MHMHMLCICYAALILYMRRMTNYHPRMHCMTDYFLAQYCLQRSVLTVYSYLSCSHLKTVRQRRALHLAIIALLWCFPLDHLQGSADAEVSQHHVPIFVNQYIGCLHIRQETRDCTHAWD